MRLAVIPGDGIGPEVTEATQKVLHDAKVDIDWEVHHAGLEVVKLTGSPLPASVIDAVRKNKVALKGPVTTPIGKGFRSVNVTLRQTPGYFADLHDNLQELEIALLAGIVAGLVILAIHYVRPGSGIGSWHALPPPAAGKHAPAQHMGSTFGVHIPPSSMHIGVSAQTKPPFGDGMHGKKLQH